MEKMELRSQETALTSDSSSLTVSGYVNVPGQLSEVLRSGAKQFRERIAPGAFKRAIERAKDIHFLVEHNDKQILSSTRNNSLQLREEDKGFFMSAEISPTTYGKDSFQLVKDGILQNLSFGFRSLKDSWTQVNGMAIRTVEDLELYEISLVRDPAYTQSSIQARSINIEQIEVPDLKDLTENKEEERGIDMIKMTNEIRGIEEFEKELRALSTTANGTALIPENVQQEIIKKMEEVSPAFAQARKINSVNGSLKVAKENDAIIGGFFGEGESILEEAINFTYVELKQKRLGAAASLSNQLINDSAVELVAYVKDLLGRRVAKVAEQAIFNGDGLEQFTGIMGDASVDKKQYSLATTLVIEHLMDLYTALHPSFLDGSAFYMSRAFFNKAVKLKDSNGHFYVQNGIVNAKPTYTLFGQPVYVTEALAAGDTALDVPVVFANLEQAYSIMVKKGMAIQQIVDGTQALKGAQLLVLDGYMDGAVVNSQAIVKLEVIA